MLAAAVESAPGVARTRPVAPRDRESIRKVATSGLDCRFGHPRPSGLDGGCPRASRLQACSAGEPWHQFVGSGRRAGKQVLSYGRTPVPSASGRFRCLVGSNVLSFLAPQAFLLRPTKVGPRDRKVARGRVLCVGMSAGALAIA